ncbi:MAG TPA: DUF3592 domain-containing protein [Parvularculaceae bacterium]|nr:DUF3592 domain-containing protein [Parvularculaceae bacterium]
MSGREELKGTLGAFILFGIVVMCGVLAAYAAVEDYARARASLSWPAVDGVVLSRGKADGEVRYAWFDGADSHTGGRVRFWTGAVFDTGAVYQPGKPIKVHVSPDDGSLAVLEPGGSGVLFAVVLGFGAFLVFVGLAGIIRLTMLMDGLHSANALDGQSAPDAIGDPLVESRSREFDLMERRRFRDRRREYPGGGVFEGGAFEPRNSV